MNTDERYNITKRFATETNALLCEKSQIVVSARWFPATASDLRTKAKVFLQGCPLAPDHRVHDLEAVARRQSRRDCHGGNFAHEKAQNDLARDFLPLERRYGLRDNRSIKPEKHPKCFSPCLKGLRHTVQSGFRLNG